MNEPNIVDRGRGPQLSTSRITVQDLLPYLQQGYSHEQIRTIMPVLTVEDIVVVEQYIRDHLDEVMEQDRRIRERAAARRKPQKQQEAEHRELLQRLEDARRRIQKGSRSPSVSKFDEGRQAAG